MKTSKEKSKELVKKYLLNVLDEKNRKFLYHSEAIECAKIAVDEIIETLEEIHKEYELFSDISDWQEVKNELNKML